MAREDYRLVLALSAPACHHLSSSAGSRHPFDRDQLQRAPPIPADPHPRSHALPRPPKGLHSSLFPHRPYPPLGPPPPLPPQGPSTLPPPHPPPPRHRVPPPP